MFNVFKFNMKKLFSNLNYMYFFYLCFVFFAEFGLNYFVFIFMTSKKIFPECFGDLFAIYVLPMSGFLCLSCLSSAEESQGRSQI